MWLATTSLRQLQGSRELRVSAYEAQTRAGLYIGNVVKKSKEWAGQEKNGEGKCTLYIGEITLSWAEKFPKKQTWVNLEDNWPEKPAALVNESVKT